jgi:hypothetical protein
VTAKVVGSGALLGSEFLDVRDSKLTNRIVSPTANDKGTGFEMLNFPPGIINRFVVSKLARKTGETIKKI